MLKYSASMVSRPFLYLEMKKAASLKLEGLNDKEIRKKAMDENIFLVKSESRNKELISTTIKRMKVLDDFLLDRIVNGNIETSKQVVLYSIMKTDLLFFEFMNEIYKEKYILNDLIITDKDLNIFFERKSEQSERVNSWKDYTYYKLKQVYLRVLYEANFVKKDNKIYKIKPPIIQRELIDYITKKGDKSYIEAMLGEI